MSQSASASDGGQPFTSTAVVQAWAKLKRAPASAHCDTIFMALSPRVNHSRAPRQVRRRRSRKATSSSDAVNRQWDRGQSPHGRLNWTDNISTEAHPPPGDTGWQQLCRAARSGRSRAE